MELCCLPNIVMYLSGAVKIATSRIAYFYRGHSCLNYAEAKAQEEVFFIVDSISKNRFNGVKDDSFKRVFIIEHPKYLQFNENLVMDDEFLLEIAEKQPLAISDAKFGTLGKAVEKMIILIAYNRRLRLQRKSFLPPWMIKKIFATIVVGGKNSDLLTQKFK